MSITFFGAIWILLLLVLFSTREIKSLISVLFFSMVLQCNNVIVIGGKGIGPQLITSAFFVVTCFLITRNSIERKFLFTKSFLIMLSLFLSYVILNALLLGTWMDAIAEIASLLLYLLACFCLYNLRNCISDSQVWIIIKHLYVFLIIVGGLQFLATTGIIPKWLLSELFFNDHSEYVYYHVNYFYPRVTSTFMEPSYFSGLFCGLLLAMIYNRRKVRHSSVYIYVGIAELLLTMSTTGYLTFMCGLLAIIAFDASKKTFYKYLPVLFLLFIFIVFSWNSVIREVVLNKMESESGVERQRWNLIAIEEFQTSPMFGHGYGKVRASNLLLTILANLGMIGLFVYVFSIFIGLKPLFSKKVKKIGMHVTARLIMFCVVVSQMIACPDLTLCTFWLSVYVVAITGKKDDIVYSRSFQRAKSFVQKEC